jgi:hypothetical protein
LKLDFEHVHKLHSGYQPIYEKQQSFRKQPYYKSSERKEEILQKFKKPKPIDVWAGDFI